MSYNVLIFACVLGICIYVIGLFLNNLIIAVVGFTVSIVASLMGTECLCKCIYKYYNECRYYRRYNSRSVA